MGKIDTGGAACPGTKTKYHSVLGEPYTAYYDGKTKLDYFAGQALVGFCSHPDFKIDVDTEIPGQRMARTCYMLARAMIAEKRRLEKQ